MTDDDLAAIEARADAADAFVGGECERSQADVRPLLAEVRRLQSEAVEGQRLARADAKIREHLARLRFSSADENARHLRLTLWEPMSRRGTVSVSIGDGFDGRNETTAVCAIAAALAAAAGRG